MYAICQLGSDRMITPTRPYHITQHTKFILILMLIKEIPLVSRDGIPQLRYQRLPNLQSPYSLLSIPPRSSSSTNPTLHHPSSFHHPSQKSQCLSIPCCTFLCNGFLTSFPSSSSSPPNIHPLFPPPLLSPIPSPCVDIPRFLFPNASSE